MTTVHTGASHIRRRMVLTTLAAILVAATASAQDGRLRVAADEIRWPSAQAGGTGTSGAAGIETVILKGNPANPGLYTIVLRVAPNVRIQPHSHRDDRVATVVKGTWYFGYGERFDESALKALAPGSFYTEPPNTPHFAMTRDEVILQITGVGPSATTYVDPANDPTRK